MKPTPSPKSSAGFTRLEALVSVVVAAILAGLMPPLMGTSQSAARKTECLVNLRLLARAWQLYATDNRDRLISASFGTGVPDWTGGNQLDYSPVPVNYPGNRRSPLLPYLENDRAFRCPADFSRVRTLGSTLTTRRVRSFSLNTWTGGPGWASSGDRWVIYTRMSDFNTRGPAQTFTFLDEHEDSINDGSFTVDMTGYPNSPNQTRMVDFPSSRHDRGGNFAFADQHAENWRWKDPRTSPPVRYNLSLALNVPQGNNPDIVRLQAHATTRR